MSEDAHKTTEGAVLIKRIGRNVLNVGIFLVEVLFLILAGPALLKFFMPVVLGWLIACIANPLVKFLEKRLHIVRKHSSFVVILGAILLIVLGCYYGITALFYEGAKIVERFPTYYATLLDSLNHLGDQLQQLVGRMSPEMSDKIEQLTDLITSNPGTDCRKSGKHYSGCCRKCGKEHSVNSDIVFYLLCCSLTFYCAERPDPEDGEKAGSNGYSRTAEAGMESTHLCVGRIFPCTVQDHGNRRNHSICWIPGHEN